MNCTKEFHRCVFKCSECIPTFYDYRFDKLKLHIMTHGNIKPFKCEVCSSGFSRKEHLNTHVSKVDLLNWPGK